MANAIDAVRLAEKSAKEIIDKANEEARKRVADSETRGKETLAKARKTAENENIATVGKAKDECAAIEKESDKASFAKENEIISLAKSGMDKAVKLIVEKAVAQWQ